MTRHGREPGPIAWSVVGGLMGAGRFATIFTVTLLVQAPAVAWAILVPGFAVHTTFGIASGFVSYHVVKSIRGLRDRMLAAPLEMDRDAEKPAVAGEKEAQ